MKKTLLLLLSALLACSLAAPVGAAETPAAKDVQPPPASPPGAAPPAGQNAKSAEPVVTAPVMKLGYVDLMRIAAESEAGKAGKAQISELKDKLQKQIEAKRKQLEKQRAGIESKLQTLTPQQREAKGKEFQKKLEEYQKFGMNAEKELVDRQEEVSGTLYKAVEQASTEYGKANGLSVVIVKRELLYIGSGVDAQDVTDGIIKQIDRK